MSIDRLRLASGDRVLIVGAGTGPDLDFLPSNVHVTAIDVTPAMLKLMAARRTLTVRAATERYTRIVGWKQRVNFVVLAVFAALPVSGPLCAMKCDSAAAAASTHHGSDQNCEETARPSTGVQIEGVSDHDCGNHDAAIRQVASTAPERVELKATAIVFALSAGHTWFSSLPLSAPAIDDTSPPGTAPRTTTPLVLRV